MLSVIQPRVGLWWLAWVSWVPFVLVCRPAAKLKQLAIIAYIVSLCYWLVNLYWVAPVTWPGWLAFCVYTAVLWPILVFAVQVCRAKKVPLFIALPILIVGVERLQGLFLGGFYWRFLGHSQYANITVIQIADIFGAAGVSFLVGMVNGLAAELIIAVREKKIFKTGNFFKTAVVCAAAAGAVIYGRWRIGQTEQFIEAGPLVGSVQSNVPQSVKESLQESDAIFKELLKQSKASAEAGAKLIVWPETMVQASLEPKVLNLLESSHSYRIFDSALREHSKGSGVFVLVGAYGGLPEIEEDWTISLTSRYNSAYLYRPDGQQAPEQYNKIHLVPFGEFVPFKKSFPFLYNLLMKFTPYDYDYTLDAGSEYTVFEMSEGEGAKKLVYRFGVMICYEDTVPGIARRFARSEGGPPTTAFEGRRKNVNWLVNISNDGWFVRFKDGKVLASAELAQHTAICVFRAVENRLAVVRSVNTGISCVIDSLGRVRNGFSAGTLPSLAMARTGCEGWLVDRVPVDKRSTIFSKYGQWLDIFCAGCVFLLIIVSVVGRFIRNKK